MVQKFLYMLLLFLALQQQVNAQGMPDADIEKPAPDSFLVAFETSKGSFEAMVHRRWSPLAADRFYHLIRVKFFDELSIFRVVEDYVAQFGIHNSADVNRAWRNLGLEDEPVRRRNTKGTISFARGGPKTRTTQLFINLKDNDTLNAMTVGGVRGYPPIAQITAGFEVIDSLNATYGNSPATQQDSINAHGRAFLDRNFPGLDYFKTVRVVKEY